MLQVNKDPECRNGQCNRNAGDLIDKLTINYNRSRQAAITKELIEIISGGALKGAKYANKFGTITQVIGAVVDVNLMITYLKLTQL